MEENKLASIKNEDIKSLIYTVRGRQVILDSDVAMLYKKKKKKINQTVKRNIDRFPEKFCFQLTENEYLNLRSQFVTSSLERENYGSRRYLPYVFTEQGIAMLSGLLRNNIAIQVSINIIDAFIEMRRFLIANRQIFERLTTIEYKLLEYDKKFDMVFNELQKDSKKTFKEKIFFNGQIWDSYSFILNIIKQAKNKITIIDNYIDDSILDMLSKKQEGVDVIILTSNNSNILKLDVRKFNKEYPTLKVSRTSKFHDRFIIIDNKELYHCGASLKDLGRKCFGISKIEESEYLESITEKIAEAA